MCWFGGFPGVWQYSTASVLSKEDVILSCYNENWVKAVSLLRALLAELHLRRGSETKTTAVWDREMLRGRKWTPSDPSGTELVHISFRCKKPNGVRSAASHGRDNTGQSGDNPLPQQPHITGPVSSCGGLQSRGKHSRLLSTMVILRHSRWPIWIQLSLFCFLPAELHLCQIAIFLVIHCVHPHKDFCFVFDSLQVTFNWILDFEGLMVPQSTAAFVCLEEIFVDPELVKSINLPLLFSGDVLVLSYI